MAESAAAPRDALPLQGGRETGSLLGRWAERFDATPGFSVLDFGGLAAETINSLAEFPCRVYCADVLTDLCLPPRDDLAAAARLFEDRLSFIGDGVIDYCLLWDFPHYLTAPQLTIFARCLQRYLHIGTGMHLYAAMNGRSRIEPWRYGWQVPDGIVRRPVRRPEPAWPHTQTEVVDAMEYVRLDRGTLRDGRVEVLLECV